MATTKATTLAHTLGGISSDISTAEINRLDGVTGDIQTLLNLKAPIASPTFTGNVTAPDVLSTNLKHASSSSNNIVLASNGSVSKSKTIAFRFAAGGSQTTASNAWPPPKVTLGTSTNQRTFEEHYGSTNFSNSEFTVPVAGVYVFGGLVIADYGTSGPRDLNDQSLFVNYTPTGGSMLTLSLAKNTRSSENDDQMGVSGCTLLNCSVGDTAHLGFYFSEGTINTTITGNSVFWGYLLF